MAKTSKSNLGHKEIADHFGVSYHTVKTSWVKLGMPGEPGSFDLHAIEHWVRTRLKRLPPNLAVNDDGAKEREEEKRKLAEIKRREVIAKAELSEYNARLKAIQYQKEADQSLVSLDRVELFLTALFTYLRRELLAIPKYMKSAYSEEVGLQIEEDLTERHEIVLRALHSEAERLTDLREK